MLPIRPENGKNFTLRELYEYLECSCIEVIHPPGRTGAVMVIDECGKNDGKPINELATRVWCQWSAPGSSRAGDPIMGHAVLCHLDQLKDDEERAEAREASALPHLVPWKLLPPAPGVCQECAVEHDPRLPHNKQSLYYQFQFYGEHGRWPTWADAMEHCSEEMKTTWIEELTARGEKIK